MMRNSPEIFCDEKKCNVTVNSLFEYKGVEAESCLKCFTVTEETFWHFVYRFNQFMLLKKFPKIQC